MKSTFARLLAGCLLAACAGSAQTQPPAASPEPSPAAPPAAQSQSAYPGAASNGATPPSAGGAPTAPQTETRQPAPASAPPQAPAMTPADSSRDRAEASKANASKASASAGELARAEREIANGDCATACRALGSMERAVAFICMQPQGDDGGANPCADARMRLMASRRRVRSSCGSCTGGPSVDPDAPVPSTR